MNEHISFICKTAFLEFRRISTIRHSPTGDAAKTLLVFSYFHALIVTTLSRLVSFGPLLTGFRESKSVQTVL